MQGSNYPRVVLGVEAQSPLKRQEGEGKPPQIPQKMYFNSLRGFITCHFRWPGNLKAVNGVKEREETWREIRVCYSFVGCWWLTL